MRQTSVLGFFALLLLITTPALAQRGKIAGTITDAASGETLPGVNIFLTETEQGAATDVDGYYFINNVRPGTYTLRVTLVGYQERVIQAVRVSTGLTTTQDIQLQEAEIGLEELVVVSERPIVQLDVSANVASLNAEAFEDLPVAGVTEVLDLQAGIEPGLRVRGGGLNEVAFVVDGMNLRTGRSHQPFTNISYTSLEEVQVQTGGFNAEYGNVRSGIVNVATKEPSRTRYNVDALMRYIPAQPKVLDGLGGVNLADCDYSGPVRGDCDSWFIRPFLDPAVAMDGTEGVWDQYTQRQYNSFEGWVATAERLQADGFDVTAQDMQNYFRHTHRKDNEITVPDYEADVSLSGPLVPGLSSRLGDLRFLVSYRGTQTSYLYPQSRDAFNSTTFQGKVVSNIRRGMKLTLHGMMGTERGVNRWQGSADLQMYNGNMPSYPWWGAGTEIVDGINRRGRVIFSDGAFALANIDHSLWGATFTHTLSANTFYEVSLQNLGTKYRSHFPNLRDGSHIDENGNFVQVPYTDNLGRLTEAGKAILQEDPTRLTSFGGDSDLNGDGEVVPYYVGDEPFGFLGQGGNLRGGDETTGGHWVKTRDTSDVSVFTGRFDLTSQLTRVLQVKTGAELIISDYDLNYKRVNLALVGPEPEADYPLSRTPIQGAAYAQGKLEFQGMIANLGVRLDFFDANTPWWVVDNPYDAAFRQRVDGLDELLDKEDPAAQIFVSPRLGVSFPITLDSKLYFNYGHFRQMLNPFDVFGIQQSRNGGIDVIGNPAHPMPLTVAYELGF